MKKMLALALLAATAAVAHAGARFAYPVSVGSNAASGSLGSARNSADVTQYIDCYTASASGFAPSGTCVAIDASGRSGVCVTTDPALLADIRSLGADGYVNFRWNSGGTCTSISVYHSSYLAPKNP